MHLKARQRWLCVLGLALVSVAATPAAALAARGLVVGVNEDALKWRPGIASTAKTSGSATTG